jgi:hypothetical protein
MAKEIKKQSEEIQKPLVQKPEINESYKQSVPHTKHYSNTGGGEIKNYDVLDTAPVIKKGQESSALKSSEE